MINDIPPYVSASTMLLININCNKNFTTTQILSRGNLLQWQMNWYNSKAKDHQDKFTQHQINNALIAN